MRGPIIDPRLLDSIAQSAPGLTHTLATIRKPGYPVPTPLGGLTTNYPLDEDQVSCYFSTPPYQTLVDKFGEQVAARIVLAAMFPPRTEIVEGWEIIIDNRVYSVIKVANSVTPEAPVSVALGDTRTIPRVVA